MSAIIAAWIAMALSVGSFVVFAILALRKPPSSQQPGGGKPGGVQESVTFPAPGDVADLAEKLGKAGPMATAASLSVFFFIVALIAAGIIEIAVDTAAGAAAAEETAAQ